MRGDRRLHFVLGILVVALFVALIPSMPYGYYPLMRWIVSAACIWLALFAYRIGVEGWAWIWGVLAGIYNPIVPVHATREIWVAVNLASIGAAWFFWWLGPRVGKSNEPPRVS